MKLDRRLVRKIILGLGISTLVVIVLYLLTICILFVLPFGQAGPI